MILEQKQSVVLISQNDRNESLTIYLLICHPMGGEASCKIWKKKNQTSEKKY